MKNLRNAKFLALLGVLLAIEIILAFTPLGFVPLVFTKATTVHIPVIIGAIFLGPTAGVILGCAFGMISVIINTISPALTSFVFSPFITVGGTQGNIWSLVIALVPRMMIGITAYYSYKWVNKWDQSKVVAYATAGVVGALTNTILVMGGIYIFFGSQYAAAKEVGFEALFGVIMGIVGINGVPEAIVSAVLVATICKVLKKVFREKLY